jgi:4-hydroxy-tetrahydrodipicolinate reductase
MTRIAITGAAGRMGRMLVEAVHQHPLTTLTAALEHPDSPSLSLDAGQLAGIGAVGVEIGADLTAITDQFDVLIDFTRPAATLSHLAHCQAHGKRIVIGTTGFSAAEKHIIQQAAQETAVVFAPNMSVAVNLTFKLVEIAAKVLEDSVDVEIIEAHHRHKVDAPSGTPCAWAKLSHKHWDVIWPPVRCTAAKDKRENVTVKPSVLPPSVRAILSENTRCYLPIKANAWKLPIKPPVA